MQFVRFESFEDDSSVSVACRCIILDLNERKFARKREEGVGELTFHKEFLVWSFRERKLSERRDRRKKTV
jgi:hypothetical protein